MILDQCADVAMKISVVNCRPSAEELLNHSFFKQTKKYSYQQLPEMLQPLTPLTDSVLKNSQNTGALSGLTHDMSEMSMSEETWDL